MKESSVTGMLVIDAVLAEDSDSVWDALAHLALPAFRAGVFLDGVYHPHDTRLHDRGIVGGSIVAAASRRSVGFAHSVAARVRQHLGTTDHRVRWPMPACWKAQ